MGGEIRAADRKTGPRYAPAAHRQMALGRGGDHDQRRATLAVARRGQQRRSSRHLRANAPQCAGGEAFHFTADRQLG